MAAVAHLAVRGAGGGGQGVKKMLLKQARMVPLEETGSRTRVRRAQGRSLAGANPGDGPKEDKRFMDRRAPRCGEEADRGRRMGAEETVRCWLVGRI